MKDPLSEVHWSKREKIRTTLVQMAEDFRNGSDSWTGMEICIKSSRVGCIYKHFTSELEMTQLEPEMWSLGYYFSAINLCDKIITSDDPMKLFHIVATVIQQRKEEYSPTEAYELICKCSVVDDDIQF